MLVSKYFIFTNFDQAEIFTSDFFFKKSVKQVIIGINISVDNKKGTVLLQVINLERQKKKNNSIEERSYCSKCSEFFIKQQNGNKLGLWSVMRASAISPCIILNCFAFIHNHAQ